MLSVSLLVSALLAAQTAPLKPPAAKQAKPAAKPSKRKPAAAKSTPALATEEEKIVYALGLSIYRSLARFDLSPAELMIVKQALSDAAAHKPAVELSAWGPKIDEFGRARAGRAAEAEKGAAKAYLDKAAAEPGAVRTGSGLVYRELAPGSGASPTATDRVKVHYRGTLVSGAEFDSSYRRNQPAEFPLNGVIRCWTEGVQRMKTGGKSVLVCPSDIAYGDMGRPPTIPGGAALIFEIELIEIVP
jgi:FKBP-type peptidyl-prolyl cis-trans isomerase FkpA